MEEEQEDHGIPPSHLIPVPPDSPVPPPPTYPRPCLPRAGAEDGAVSSEEPVEKEQEYDGIDESSEEVQDGGILRGIVESAQGT